MTSRTSSPAAAASHTACWCGRNESKPKHSRSKVCSDGVPLVDATGADGDGAIDALGAEPNACRCSLMPIEGDALARAGDALARAGWLEPALASPGRGGKEGGTRPTTAVTYASICLRNSGSAPLPRAMACKRASQAPVMAALFTSESTTAIKPTPRSVACN